MTWRPRQPLFSCEPKGLLETPFSTLQHKERLPLFVPFDSLSITVNCGAGALGICQISKLNMILTGSKSTGANNSLVVSQGGKALRDTILKAQCLGWLVPVWCSLAQKL